MKKLCQKLNKEKKKERLTHTFKFDLKNNVRKLYV